MSSSGTAGSSSAAGTVVRFAGHAVCKAGLLPLALRVLDRMRAAEAEYQILLYHRVNDENDPFFAGVSVRDFERQMRLVRRHFNVLPLEQLLERCRAGDLPPRAMGITFDDGYRDNYLHAYPVLRKYGLPATIYLATGPIEGQGALWHERVFAAFRVSDAATIEIESRSYSLAGFASRRVALYALLDVLRLRSPAGRDAMIGDVLARLGVDDGEIAGSEMLSWDEIGEMAEGGISLGAHTVRHPILSRMQPVEAQREILDSKRTIEERLGRPVRLFAYPNGGPADFDESTKRTLREAGFLCAVTTIWGSNDGERDAFELRRVRMWDADPRISVLRLALDRARSAPQHA